jgi:hypothetical protein
MASGGIHRRCMEGTRRTILDRVEEWRLDPLSLQVLWLADVAGAGKSTVAKEVAEKWKEQGCLAGRFFFSRDAEETRTSKLFFSTIAQQGLSQIGPETRAAVALGIRQLINPVSATLEDQYSNIFYAPLKATQDLTILVLDALDECEQQTCQQLLRVLFSRLSNLPHLRIFITSRPELHIRVELEKISHHELSLRSDEISNSKDVEIFMKERLRKALLSESIIEQIIDRAGGLFIWAKTVCDLLENFRGNRDSFIERILSTKLRQMDSVYRIALDQAIGTDREDENMEAYMNVLRIIVAAYEPLSPNTIDRLLNSSETMDIVGDLRSVLECAGEDDLIRFLHPTFREFLLNSNDCGRYYVDINAAHELVIRGCFFVMDEELQYDKCGLYNGQKIEFTPEELDNICLTHTSSALRYSCVFWTSHITSLITSVPSSLTSMIENFYRSKLLDWIYMIGIQGSLDRAVPMLRKLISGNSVRDFKLFMQSN